MNNMRKKFFLEFGIIIVIMLIATGCGTKKSPVPVGGGSVSPTNDQVEQNSAPKVERFPNDLDRDGIDNATEKQLGLSETEFDTDGDGLSDYTEVNTYKTNPKSMDTDGDGYTDADEIMNGYNPNGSGKMPKTQ